MGTYDPVKLAPLIALWPSQMVLRLTRAELSEVFCCLGDDVCEELKFYAAEFFSWFASVKWSSRYRRWPRFQGRTLESRDAEMSSCWMLGRMGRKGRGGSLGCMV